MQKTDVDEHCPTEKCPGCRPHTTSKYNAKHTGECQKRFETILGESTPSKRRFEPTVGRRLNAITKRLARCKNQMKTRRQQRRIIDGQWLRTSAEGKIPSHHKSDASDDGEPGEKYENARMENARPSRPAAYRRVIRIKRNAKDNDLDLSSGQRRATEFRVAGRQARLHKATRQPAARH